MQLSNRLLAVSELVTGGSRLADVGTDHGYIPIYLIQQKKIPSAIAMDINIGPLQRAAEHIEEHGLQAYIEVRLSDGVCALMKEEADSVIMAGMGGNLIRKILLEGKNVLETVSELILQPQSEIGQVRRFLSQYGYRIIEENMILEDGKYYPMMKAIHGSMDSEQAIFMEYGKELLLGRHPVLKQFLRKEKRLCQELLSNLQRIETEQAKKRTVELEQELQQITAALNYYEM